LHLVFIFITASGSDCWFKCAWRAIAVSRKMAEKLRKANPEAFRNIIGRMLEANGRSFWQPSKDKLQRLRDLYDFTDEELEGVTV